MCYHKAGRGQRLAKSLALEREQLHVEPNRDTGLTAEYLGLRVLR
jgi:hypothetical protein